MPTASGRIVAPKCANARSPRSIIFYKEFEHDDKECEDGLTSLDCSLMVKASRIFNVAQVDGYEREEIDAGLDLIDLIASTDTFIQTTGVVIHEGGECFR